MMKLVSLFLLVVLCTGCGTTQDEAVTTVEPTITQCIATSTPVAKTKIKYLSSREMFWEEGFEPILQSALDKEMLTDTRLNGTYALVQRENYLLIMTYLKIASVDDLETISVDGRDFTVINLEEYSDSNSKEVAYVEVDTGLAYVFSPTSDTLSEDEIQSCISSIGVKSSKNAKKAIAK